MKPVSCGEPGCDHVFPRDPVLEVPCPVCGAEIGIHCASVAPSGHRKSRGFSGLAAWGHDARELAAAADGAYRHRCSVPDDELERRIRRAQEKLGRVMVPEMYPEPRPETQADLLQEDRPSANQLSLF